MSTSLTYCMNSRMRSQVPHFQPRRFVTEAFSTDLPEHVGLFNLDPFSFPVFLVSSKRP